jgi:hypothetical protein
MAVITLGGTTVGDPRDMFDLTTAALWFGLAAFGIVRRVRRLIHLHQIILVKPEHPRDVDYLDSVKRSTMLRLGVKFVFLIGACIALFHLPVIPLWRVGVILALIFMSWETASVDRIRDRLGSAAEGEKP